MTYILELRMPHRSSFLSPILFLSLCSSAFATWSIVAVDQKTRRVAIASATCVAQDRFAGFPARGLMDVQAIVVPGKGVAAAQAAVDPTRKNQELIFREIQKGTPPAAILGLLKQDPEIERRQFGVVDLEGRMAGFSGSGNGKASLDVQSELAGEGVFFSVQGNILAGEEVVHAAVRAFRMASGDLADRVMAAMEAADASGGDRRCTCDTPPSTAAPCEGKTAHVAYLVVAEPGDPNGASYNDGRYDLYLSVTDQDIQPHENANPVRTLRMRYEAWKAGAAAPVGLTLDSLMSIRFPSRAVWSPKGDQVAFVWDRGGKQNVWVVGATSGPPRALTQYPEGFIDALFWSADGRLVFYAREGDLWQVSFEGGEPRPKWQTAEGEGDFALSPDGGRVAFVRGGDLWVRSLADDKETRLTATQPSEYGPVWSPDGERLAFTFSSGEPRQDFFDYVGAKLAFRRFERTLSDVGVVPTAGGGSVVIAPSPGAETTPRWVDRLRLSLQRVSTDYRTREVLLADAERGEARLLHRDSDEKWWSIDYLGPEPTPSPDGRWVAFLSDRDGWDHLYVVPTTGGGLHQITRGDFEVGRPAWSPDGQWIAFDTNEGHPGQRHLAVAEIGGDPSRPRIVRLTRGRGTNTQPTDRYGFILERAFGGWSPESRRLVYHHTDPQESGDLFVVEAAAGAAPPSPRRLTYSMPASVDSGGLVEPEMVRYRASDGAEVPAYLFLPRGLDRSRRHPAIVWIHGDGIAQNHDGWHIRRDYAVYYSFHQYLAQNGYVVLAPDYRGSVGYGREWRRAPYRDVGGRDFQDVADSIPYLRSLGFVDIERVGVWGLSYGGFFTLQALTLTPELFRCGVDVAGVQDYRYWYRDPGGRWIVSRMGSPEENPEAYSRAAPIERIDRIERPLLVLHGTADFNVPFLESVRLVDALTRAGKDAEFMMYPGELHYFHREHVLRDAWQRVERFFERHLRAARAHGSP